MFYIPLGSTIWVGLSFVCEHQVCNEDADYSKSGRLFPNSVFNAEAGDTWANLGKMKVRRRSFIKYPILSLQPFDRNGKITIFRCGLRYSCHLSKLVLRLLMGINPITHLEFDIDRLVIRPDPAATFESWLSILGWTTSKCPSHDGCCKNLCSRARLQLSGCRVQFDCFCCSHCSLENYYPTMDYKEHQRWRCLHRGFHGMCPSIHTDYKRPILIKALLAGHLRLLDCNHRA